MKKGASLSMLAIAVVLIALLVVFIVLLVKFKSESLRILDDTECKGSIASHVMLLKATGNAAVTDIYCPTKYYTIPRASDDEIKHYLAEAMKTCWSTWGEGELRLFNGDGLFCHVCSVIDFKDKEKVINGFDDYLASVPFKQGTSVTYFDYLTGFRSEKAPQLLKDQMLSQNYLDTIDTSQSYATIFVYARGESGVKAFIDGFSDIGLGTAGSGITTGLVLGTAGTIAVSVATGGLSLIVIGASILTTTIAGGIVGAAASDDVAWVASIALIPYNTESVSDLGCRVAPVRQEKISAIT